MADTYLQVGGFRLQNKEKKNKRNNNKVEHMNIYTRINIHIYIQHVANSMAKKRGSFERVREKEDGGVSG